MTKSYRSAFCLSLTIAIANLTSTPLSAADWLQFRGSDGSSLAAASTPPLKFSATENVAWKSPLPGKGVSGPIVVGDKVYVTASSGAVTQNRLHVLCFDVATGKQLWHRQFWATGRCFHHPTSANAAPTPASDGERIFAFYSSNDLICLDIDGNLLWYRGLSSDYPKAGNDVGMSSSPLVVGETVVVQIENQGDSFAAGINTTTGETSWRIDRPKDANWVSPVALKGADGKQLVLLQSPDRLTAHVSATGDQVWEYKTACAGIPSATTVDGKIYLPSNGLTVLDAPADSSSAKLAWESSRLSPGNSSPLIYKDKVYILTRAGVITCGDAATGEVAWQLRLKGTFWTTPVLAANHLFCVNQDGECLVAKIDGEKGEIAETNSLGESVLGSPAVSGNALFIRSDKHLWKIAAP
jgi:outer membrane protein assembly factor BamB